MPVLAHIAPGQSSAICTRAIFAQPVKSRDVDENGNIARNALKSLRLTAKLSLQQLADRLDIPLTTYRHWEERAKGRYLPQELVEKLVPILAECGIEPGEVLSLADVSVRHGLGAFSESRAPYTESAATRRLRQAVEGAEEPESQVAGDFKIGSDGKRLQIIATVDREGVDELIRKLKIMKEILA